MGGQMLTWHGIFGAAAWRAFRHHEHGTIHWHSTPGVENGSQLLGRSFPLHGFLYSCFPFRAVNVGKSLKWEAFGDGRGEQSALHL